MQRNKDSNIIERKVRETLTVARREPEGKDNDSINTVNSLNTDSNKMVPLGKNIIYSLEKRMLFSILDFICNSKLFADLPTETMYSTEDNGKINIHVSVTINASTLAELKKQRAQHRNSSPDISLYPNFHPVVPAIENGIGGGGGGDPDTPAVKRFAGNTGDQLVGDPRTTRCCVLL